jgi:hypothetical protein
MRRVEAGQDGEWGFRRGREGFQKKTVRRGSAAKLDSQWGVLEVVMRKPSTAGLHADSMRASMIFHF